MCRRACHRRNSSSVLTSDYCSVRRDARCDWIPVDVAINLSLVVGWKTATQPRSDTQYQPDRQSDLIFSCRNKTLPVYNCTSGGVNPVTWGYFETTGMKITRKFPMENILWYPGGSYKENKTVNSVCEVSKDLTKRRGGERVCVFSLSNTPFLLTSVTPHSGS